nr:hypothetical protein Hi04_10k_c5714_00031 [uncultured bacterium]
MDCWSDVLSRITPFLHDFVAPISVLAEAWQTAPTAYGWLGLCGGYVLVMLFAPVRQALGDGFHCLRRYQRIWITFGILGFGYFLFQFVTFTPIRNLADLEPGQITSLPQWAWPGLSAVWRETLLPALEGVAGIFDNATTTYPVSVIAAVLMIVNWRGLHSALVRALRKRYGFWGYAVYLILLLSALASLLKPIVFWRLPHWSGLVPAAGLLRISATVDGTAFIFEYLLGVYIQVYLITVCLAWVKGVSFEEGELFRFAMRRFSYVLEWAGIVVAVSTLILRFPLVLAYFVNIPDVLDYLPVARLLMSGLIIALCSVQISLVLHNETLIEAMSAHVHFIRKNAGRLAWFLVICGIHFYGIMLCDAILRGAIGDRLGVLFLWKFSFAYLRAMITGWLLASWVCLFRQCETGRIHQEKWIQY